jgi:hypothetical protein
MGSVAKKVGGVVKGAVGGALSGGPWGALTGGIGGLFGGGGNTLPGQHADEGFGFPAGDQAGGFWNWIKNNGSTLGNIGLLGATIAGGGNPLSGIGKGFSALMDPKQLNDPRQQGVNDLSGMMSGAMAGGNFADFVTKMMGPAYGGQLNAGANQGQLDAVGGANSALANFFSGDQGQGSLANINRIAQGGFNLPPEIAALLGQGGQNDQYAQQIQQLIGTDNPAIANLLNMNNAGPGVAELGQLFNSGQAGALLSGGEGNDLNSIGSAIAQAQQPALDRRVRDMREQFSFNGLRDSTDLNAGVGQAVAESQGNLQGILAQLAPQIANTRNQTALGALQALGGIGGQMGNINTGSQQAAGQLINQQAGQGISGLSSLFNAQGQNAGVLASIFNNQNNNATQAALAQPGAFSQIAQLPQLLAQANLGMNTTMQNQQQNDLSRQYQAWQQQQSLMPNLLSILGGTGPQQYNQSLLQQLGPMLMAGYGMKQSK